MPSTGKITLVLGAGVFTVMVTGALVTLLSPENEATL